MLVTEIGNLVLLAVTALVLIGIKAVEVHDRPMKGMDWAPRPLPMCRCVVSPGENSSTSTPDDATWENLEDLGTIEDFV